MRSKNISPSKLIIVKLMLILLMGIAFLAALYFFRKPAFSKTLFSLAVAMSCFGILLRSNKWCFFVTTCLISICVLEILVPKILSWGNMPISSRMEGDYTKNYFVSNEQVGAVAMPGIHSSQKIVDENIIYDVIYTIGKDGYRVTPKTPSNALKSRSVNFFGCSFTFGEGVNDNQTLPYFYQTLTNDKVKNYGFHGYGVHQSLVQLRNLDNAKSRNVNFLLTAPWHSERSSCGASYSKGSPRFILEGGVLMERGKCRDSQYPVLERFLESSFIYDTLHSYWVSNIKQDSNIELYLRLIQEMRNIASMRREDFYVGYIKADDNWFSGKYSNEAIIKSLQDNGINTIDLTLSNQIENISPEYFIAGDGHPSPVANLRRAEYLEKFFARH